MKLEEPETLIVTADEDDLRLDRILASRYSDQHSRAYFQDLILKEFVMLNGEFVKKHVRPKKGDRITLTFLLPPKRDLAPENIPLNILYEDEDLIAINKPAGMVVHPAVGNWSGTFVNGLLYHCEIEDEHDVRPGIVHRLDKETSGVLIAAKKRRVQQLLIEQFSSRLIYKEYLAICVGNPGNISVSEPIGRHPFKRKQMAVNSNGKEAMSQIETIVAKEQLSYVKIVPKTGRTHQIRVHLKHLNASILGDSLYGKEGINHKYCVKRQLLHAHVLKFVHPSTGEKLHIKAPIPEDFKIFLDKI